MEKFASRIKDLRTARGFSQKKLGEALGMTQQAIARWENEVTTPDPDTLAKICLRFHVSADWLLGLTDDSAPVAVTAAQRTELENLPSVHLTDEELAARLPEDMRDAMMALIRIERAKSDVD